ncbi:CDC16 protein [Microsporum canis]|uniref:Cell division control protein 16 n=1 Tax=Arthroderma otae (strain ATCC MYA-4605 / CBS 113480) TaxID=554155 RepID=C5FTF9_ARTOC|nr:cell division control protein 16 [Microsporum canis CBS 113480]EEQ33162.1 cell division control protein 16 [Microsporum canis CBS 113480]
MPQPSQSRVPAAGPGGLQPPQPTRTLRRFQSHQSLSTYSNSSVLGSRPPISRNATAINTRDVSEQQAPHQPAASATTPAPTHGRGRSNSDVTGAAPGGAQPRKRPSINRKSGSIGYLTRRSGLENLLREGPPNNNIAIGLEELRYLILSTRVDADNDGMSTHRIYIWLALLDIPPLPTDEYLSLVHRGRSPAYTKIRNDTFRTLATDPLFKRRVTEASLIRLLNAVAWKIHDSKNTSSSHQISSSQQSSSRRTSSIFLPDIQAAADGQGSNLSDSAAIYVQGMNVLCAPFLYASRSEVEAYALFHHFITVECPGYARSTMDGVHKGVKLVDRCLEVVEPKLANHLFSKGMYAELYAFPSVLTLCACTPPLPEVLHLWDFLFAYGPHLNILCIVAQLIRMRDVILASPSPNKILRSFPPIDAKETIALTVLVVQKIPSDLYEELLLHAK